MHFTLSEQAIATAELYCQLEEQANAVAPEIPALVPAKIRVERVSFTRNASNTPYMVYWVGDRRCCTFIKRSRFLELAASLLKLKCGIEDKIRSLTSGASFGFNVKAGDSQHYIPSAYVNKFFERYNTVALEHTQPQENCDCNDLFDMCLHQIADLLHPDLAKQLSRPLTTAPAMPDPSLLSKYNPYARGRKAAAQNWEIYQKYRAAIASS